MNEYIKTIIYGVTTSWQSKLNKLAKELRAYADGLVSPLTKKIAKAQTAADNAQTTADNAQTTADNAQTTADNAQTTADNAQTTADNAQTTANSKISMEDLASYSNMLSASEKTEAFTNNGRTFYKIGTTKDGYKKQNNLEARKIRISGQLNTHSIGAMSTFSTTVEDMSGYESKGAPYYVCYFTNDATFSTMINNKNEKVTVQLAFASDNARSILAYVSGSLGWNGISAAELMTDILTKVDDVDKTAQTAADNAQTAADNAQTAADNAQTAADKAQTAADNAQTTADNAQTAADKAQTVADNAQTAADNAQTAADNAQSTANSAKSTADSIRGGDLPFYSGAELKINITEEMLNELETITTTDDYLTYCRIPDFRIPFSALRDTNSDVTTSVEELTHTSSLNALYVINDEKSGAFAASIIGFQNAPNTMYYTWFSVYNGLPDGVPSANLPPITKNGLYVLAPSSGVTMKYILFKNINTPVYQNLIMLSSTSGSTKQFRITVDDSGTLSATEVT